MTWLASQDFADLADSRDQRLEADANFCFHLLGRLGAGQFFLR